MSDLLLKLERKYEEQKHRTFPRDELPEEFDDLYAEWAELDGFVAGLAQRALAGEALNRQEVTPHGHTEFQLRLERFENKYPEIAGRSLDEFQFLQAMLDLLMEIAVS